MEAFGSKVGIALGGGGARGIAHIGVLRHFELMKIPVSAITGTSAGSIVAALYAFDISLDQMEAELIKMRPVEFSGLNFNKLGLFKNVSLEETLKRLLPKDAKIQNARMPLAIVTTDILTGNSVVLRRGDVVEAVMASTAVPGFYLPVEKNGMLLVDGGLTENVPISPLRDMGAHIKIGVNLNGNEGYGRPEGILDVLSNSLDIAIDARTRDQLKEADIVISLDLTDVSRTVAPDTKLLTSRGQAAALEKVSSARGLYLKVKLLWLFNYLKDLIPVRLPRQIQVLFKRKVARKLKLIK